MTNLARLLKDYSTKFFEVRKCIACGHRFDTYDGSCPILEYGLQDLPQMHITAEEAHF
jgi:hypothetical protein